MDTLGDTGTLYCINEDDVICMMTIKGQSSSMDKLWRIKDVPVNRLVEDQKLSMLLEQRQVMLKKGVNQNVMTSELFNDSTIQIIHQTIADDWGVYDVYMRTNEGMIFLFSYSQMMNKEILTTKDIKCSSEYRIQKRLQHSILTYIKGLITVDLL